MPTEKRQRQRDMRQARMEELRRAQKRSSQRKRYGIFALIAVGLFALIIAATVRGGGSKTKTKVKTATSASSTTVSSTTVSTTTVAPLTSHAVTGPTAPATIGCPKLDGSSPHYEKFTKAPPTCIDPTKTYTATVVTDIGTMKVHLLAAQAPKTVNNFVFLAGYHYFNGIVFHRVVTGFVDQTGDPTGTGTGGPGYQFGDELPKSVNDYTAGSLAMANSGANTNGSQFFLVVSNAGGKELQTPLYSLFGQVTSGLSVVQKINADGSASSAGTPKVFHKMLDVTISSP